MLKNKTTLQPDAIEKYFCEPFDQATRCPMDEETTKFLMQLLIVKEMKEMPEKKKPFLIKMIEQRIKGSFSFKITDNRLIAFIAVISETPGKAVMYLTYLQYWCRKNNIKVIDLDKFCEIFPMGFPDDETLHSIWDGQKVECKNGYSSDNLLDYQSAMKSIHFLVPAYADQDN